MVVSLTVYSAVSSVTVNTELPEVTALFANSLANVTSTPSTSKLANSPSSVKPSLPSFVRV